MAKRISGSVAITGGSGFIGACLLQRLSRSGISAHVIAPTDATLERIESLPGLRLHRVSTPQDLGPLVAGLGVSVVIHLGAVVSNRCTLENFTATLDWNLLGTLSLYEALTRTGIRRIVQTGSCEEYGRQGAPFSEDAPLDPISPYSASKAAVACYARMFHHCFQLPIVTLRPSVVYGPGQSPRMLVPEVIAALVDGRVVETTEGRQLRDFLYIEDLADAILLAAEVDGIDGQVFNIGSGQPVSVRRCVELIERLTGRDGLVQYGGRRYKADEVWEYAPNIRRARERLGWRARTSLEDGLRFTIEAYKNRRQDRGEELKAIAVGN